MKNLLNIAVFCTCLGVTWASADAVGIANGGFEDGGTPWVFEDCPIPPDPIVRQSGGNPCAYLELKTGDGHDPANANSIVLQYKAPLPFPTGRWATLQFDARCLGCGPGDAFAWVSWRTQSGGMLRQMIPTTPNWTTYTLSLCLEDFPKPPEPVDFELFFGVCGALTIGEPPLGASELQVDNICCYETCADQTNVPFEPIASCPVPPCGNLADPMPLTSEGPGCPEGQPACVPFKCCGCPDVNGDGTVNVLDLTALLLVYGLPCPAPPTPCPEDINCDGTVNVLDLTELLLAFGTSPDCVDQCRP